MFCSKCGKEVQAESRFCAQCGQEVGKPAAETTTPAQKSKLQEFEATALQAAEDSVKSQTRSEISRVVSDVFRNIFKQ